MLNQRGIAPIIFLIIGALVVGAIFVSRNLPSRNISSTLPIAVQKSPEQSTDAAKQNIGNVNTPGPLAKVAVNTITPTPSSNPVCDQDKVICFESNNLNISIVEGNIEDNDKWVTDKLYIVGQTEKGFELSWEGIPSEFTYYSADKSFPNNKKLTIFLRVYKNSAKKGIYKGKIYVKSLSSGITTAANLTLSYVDWNDSYIHADPSEVGMSCKKNRTSQYNELFMDCNYPSVTIYYFGDHPNLEIKTVPDKDSSRSLRLVTEGSSSTSFDMHNKQKFFTKFVGFPTQDGSGYSIGEQLDLEPSGSYKGYFVLIEKATQKELFRIPYTLNYNTSGN